MEKCNLKINFCLKNFPLRISITDFCNLHCFFCSNEGMPLSQKNLNHIKYKDFVSFVKILVKAGLKKISVTGGDPTMHPDIVKIVIFLNGLAVDELFFHTNGVDLKRSLVEELAKKFTKVAISIHSINFNTWKLATGGTKKQFTSLKRNIQKIKNLKDRTFKLELKYVLIKGINDSKKEIGDFLEFCYRGGFKFKFLSLEPIRKRQFKKVISTEKALSILKELGCIKKEKKESFRGQASYLPIVPIKYKDARGVFIKIGCGLPSVCRSCFKSNEIYVNSFLEIKPCHIDCKVIPLKKIISEKKEAKIFEAIVSSRHFLSKCPGKNFNYWLAKVNK